MQVQASAGQSNEETGATWTEATYQAGLDAAQRLVASYRVGEAGLKKRSAAMNTQSTRPNNLIQPPSLISLNEVQPSAAERTHR